MIGPVGPTPDRPRVDLSERSLIAARRSPSGRTCKPGDASRNGDEELDRLRRYARRMQPMAIKLDGVLNLLHEVVNLLQRMTDRLHGAVNLLRGVMNPLRRTVNLLREVASPLRRTVNLLREVANSLLRTVL